MFLFLIETALNKYFQLNPDRINKLSQKSIIISLLPINKNLKILFYNGEVRCSSPSEKELETQSIDLKIITTPQALIGFLLQGDRSSLKFEGDVVLAQVLEHSLSNITDQKTLEDFFESFLGESVFYPLKTVFKKGAEKLKNLSIKTKISDYLQEDKDCLPLSSEVKNFCDEVDVLRLRVDRLEANFTLGIKHNEKN